MEKFFDGVGFSPTDARQNAEDQISDFIKSETDQGKSLKNVRKDIQSTNKDGNLHYCTIKLTYDEN